MKLTTSETFIVEEIIDNTMGTRNESTIVKCLTSFGWVEPTNTPHTFQLTNKFFKDNATLIEEDLSSTNIYSEFQEVNYLENAVDDVMFRARVRATEDGQIILPDYIKGGMIIVTNQEKFESVDFRNKEIASMKVTFKPTPLPDLSNIKLMVQDQQTIDRLKEIA